MVKATSSNIAMDFKIGNTVVRIATDYCEYTTPEEVQKILERVARTAKRSLTMAETVGRNEKITKNTKIT